MATITIGNAALLNSITISDQIYVSAESGADCVFTDPVSGVVQDYYGCSPILPCRYRCC